MTDYGMGRLPSLDVNDGAYSVPRLMALLGAEPRTYRYWNDEKARFDQGRTSSCVGHAWTHWLAAGPVTQAVLPSPFDVYDEARDRDEWPGRDYDGSSVRGGAKALVDRGYVGSYWWASTADEVADAVANFGPVVMGTTWLYSMFEPVRGRLVVDLASGEAGGHAYLISGVNTVKRTCRVVNSWGDGWGVRGRATLRLDDLDVLLRGGGEACVATEVRLPLVPPA